MPIIPPGIQIVTPATLSPTTTLHFAQSQPSSTDASTVYPRLPIEVCERVIDAIGVEHTYESGMNNSETLLACCLTSRDWFHRASRYLYTEVNLFVNRVGTFGKQLKGRPNVPDFVKTLIIRQHKGQPHRDLSLLPRYFSQSLPNLTRIEFHHVDFTVVYPEYSLSLHRFTTVTSAVYYDAIFQSLHQLFRHLDAFSHLNFLTLARPTFRTLDAENPLSTSLTRGYKHKLHVRTVDLQLSDSNDVHVFELFLPTFITSLLLYFEEDANKTTGPALSTFLHLARGTLRQFEFHVFGDTRPHMPLGESSFALTAFISHSRYSCSVVGISGSLSLRNLRTFKLHIAIPNDTPVVSESMLTFLNDLLSNAQFPVLRTLFIVITSSKAGDFDISDPAHQKAWTALETNLSLPRYATLEHAAVRFFEWNATEQRYHPVQEEVAKAALPKLITRRNVDLTPMPFPI